MGAALTEAQKKRAGEHFDLVRIMAGHAAKAYRRLPMEEITDAATAIYMRLAASFDPATGREGEKGARVYLGYWLKKNLLSDMAARNKALADAPTVLSLDAPMTDDGQTMAAWVAAPPPGNAGAGDAADLMALAGRVLDPRRLEAFTLRRRDGLTCREAARRMGLSAERVRQLCAEAEDTLRNPPARKPPPRPEPAAPRQAPPRPEPAAGAAEGGAVAPPKDAVLITAGHVAHMMSASIRTVWRLVAAGKFPRPVRFNRKLVRWKRADIEAYIEGLRA